jgi:HEAT repeat protein
MIAPSYLNRWTLALMGLAAGLATAVTYISCRPRGHAPHALSESTATDDLNHRLEAMSYGEGVRFVQQLSRAGQAKGEGELLSLLRTTTSTRLKLLAISQLGAIGSVAAVDGLMEVIEQGQPRLPQAAVTALGQIGTAEAVEQLITLVQDKQRTTLRREAIAALGQAGGPEAVAELMEVAQSSISLSRHEAILALGATGDNQAFAALDTMLSDKNYQVQNEVISALGQMGTPSAKQKLVSLLQERHGQQRVAALSALSNFEGPDVEALLISYVENEDSELARVALGGLSEYQSDAARAVMRKLATRPGPNGEYALAQTLEQGDAAESKELLIKLLGQGNPYGAALKLAQSQDPDDRQTLFAMAQNGSPETQRAIIQALDEIPGEDVEQFYKRMLEQGSGFSSAMALQQLASRQGKTAIPLLLQSMKEGNAELKAVALDELSKMDHPEAHRVLVEAAWSNEPGLSQRSIAALSTMNTPEAESTLMDLLKNGSNESRNAAAMALAQRGGEQNRQALLEQLKSNPDSNVGYALAQMNDPETASQLSRLLEDPAVSTESRLGAVRALSYGRGNEAALLKAATQTDSKVAVEAIQGLAQSGGAEVERVLLDSLHSKNTEVKQAAIHSLTAISSPTAVDGLIGALKDPATATDAANSLSNIGNKKATEALLDHYQSAPSKEREGLISSLPASTERGRNLLLSSLNDSQPEVASRAASLLVVRGGKDIQSHLLGLLQSSPNASIRRSLAESFRQDGGRLYRENKELIEGLLKEEAKEAKEAKETTTTAGTNAVDPN